MGCLFFDADFSTFFILADKISRLVKSWAPIQNLNSVAVWEISHRNWRYDFVRFSHDLCQNAWTSSLCVDLKNDIFWISTVVLWTRKTQVSLHNINSWISFILEIPACIFSLKNSCNVQSHLDQILSQENSEIMPGKSCMLPVFESDISSLVGGGGVCLAPFTVMIDHLWCIYIIQKISRTTFRWSVVRQ